MKKTFRFGLLILLLCFYEIRAYNNTQDVLENVELVESKNGNLTFIMNAARSLKSLWNKYVKGQDDTFMGRCFGIAKKLKMLIPVFVFKLGVIVTILGFLTLFSLKSLGMLGLLLLINVSGAVSKVAVALSGKHEDKEKQWKQPQNIHFHIHKDKVGEYHVGHSSPGWEDRLSIEGNEDSHLEKLEAYNMYNKLSRTPYVNKYIDSYR